MNSKKNEITFIGFGNMGSAIVKGILKENIYSHINIIENDKLKFINSSESELKFKEKIDDNISNSKFIWMCVKPQSFQYLANEIKSFLDDDQVLISIMAGIKIDQIKELSNHSKIIRVMPNTPAQVSKGMSVWKSTNEVSTEEKELAISMLNSFGKSLEAESEDIIDTATALSGSGPGFIYKFLESLILAGKKSGLTDSMSYSLAKETLIGSSELLRVSNQTPKELREAVTSPGGTTEAGLDFLEENKIEEIIIGTIKAAIDRSIKLSKESS
ncbi:MAG: pyrroline-5-carboxylate reductase [Dehalococcoidales bacterium]|nr:pyrroline-5-carboxylate reductase [Dehalococcoidales bacterium]